MVAGPTSIAGLVNAWRSMRRAITRSQVSATGVAVRGLTRVILAGGASVWRDQDRPAAPEGPARRRARRPDGGNGCRADIAPANPRTARHLPRTDTPR